MSAAEITQWHAYEQVAGPLGGARDDILAAMIAYYVASSLGAKKVKLAKMIPQWDRRPQSWQGMKDSMVAWAKATGGTINRL